MWTTFFSAQMANPLQKKIYYATLRNEAVRPPKPKYSGVPRHITSDQVAAIQDIPQPQATKQLHAFLGLISYCRAWIPDASILTQPLYDALKSVPSNLSNKALDNFFLLKQAISTAPALGLPDYGIPFKLFVSERKGHATGFLAQQNGGRTRPIGYYSCRLDPVAWGGPSCLTADFAAQALLDKISDLVLNTPPASSGTALTLLPS